MLIIDGDAVIKSISEDTMVCRITSKAIGDITIFAEIFDGNGEALLDKEGISQTASINIKSKASFSRS